MFLRSLCLLICVSGAGLGAADDPNEIVRQALQNNNHNRELERSYTYTFREEDRTLDSAGNVKHTKSETWDIVPLRGAPFRRLTQRDDKPLSPKEEQQQAAMRQKQEEQRRKGQELRDKESPEERQKRLDARERARKKEQDEVNDIVAGFDLRLMGEEQVDGMPVWVIEGSPRKSYKFKSMMANLIFSKMKGRVWISKGDYQVVRIDAETTGTISFGLFLARVYTGSHYRMEFTYVNNEIWLPKREVATISARFALVKGQHEEDDTVYSNYKKFSTDSRLIGIDQ